MATRSRKWLVRLAVACGLLLILVALAPMLGAALFGRSAIQGALEEQLTSKVAVEEVSAGWGGAALGSLRIEQPPGFESTKTPLLEVRGIDAKASLLGLLSSPAAQVRVASLRATIVRAADGSLNVQKLVKEQAEKAKKAPSTEKRSEQNQIQFKGGLLLEDGEITIVDQATGTTTAVRKIRIDVQRPDPTALVSAVLSAVVGDAGALAADAQWDLAANAGSVTVKPQRVDLGTFSSLAAGTGALAKLAGMLDANLTLKMEASGALACDGRVLVEGLALEGGKLPAPIAEPRIELIPKFTFTPASKALALEGFSLQTSSVRVEGKGTFEPAKGGATELTFRADLQKAQPLVAPFLPPGVELAGLVSGRAALNAAASGPAAFDVSVTASGVRAAGVGDAAAAPTDGSLTLRGTAEPDGSAVSVRDGILALEPIARGKFSADWKKGTGAGALQLDADLSASLSKAAQRFGGLLPKRLRVDGEMQLAAKVATSDAGRTNAQIRIVGTNLLAAASGAAEPSDPAWLSALAASPLREPKLEVAAEAAYDGKSGEFQLSKLKAETGSGALGLDASASGNRADLASTLRAKASASGSLEKLMAYAAPWVPAGFQIGGDLALTADVAARAGGSQGPVNITIRGLRVSAAPGVPAESPAARLAAAPLAMEELSLSARVDFDSKAQSVLLNDLRLVAGNAEQVELKGSVNAAADGSRVGAEMRGNMNLTKAQYLRGFLPPGLAVDGAVALESLSVRREGEGTSWQAKVAAPKLSIERSQGESKSAYAVSGTLESSGKVTILKEKVDFDAALKAVDFSASQTGGVVLPPEPELSVAAAGSWSASGAASTLALQRATLATKSGRAAADARGSLSFGPGAPASDLQGTASADLAFVSSVAAPFLPPGTDFGGALRASFGLKGTESKSDLRAQATVEEFRATAAGAAPVTDRKLTLELTASTDRDADRISIPAASFTNSEGSIKLAAREFVIDGVMRGGAAAMRANGSAEVHADLAKLLALAPGALPPGTAVSGMLDSSLKAQSSAKTTQITANSALTQFRYAAPAPAGGTAPAPFEDARVTMDLQAEIDRDRDELKITQASASTADGSLRAVARGFTIRDLSKAERGISGEIQAALAGAALSRLAAGKLPPGMAFDGAGDLTAKLGGTVGAKPLSTLRLDATGVLPTLIFDDLRIEKTQLAAKIADGLFQTENATGELVKGTGDAAKRGTFVVNANIRIDDPAMPFALGFRTKSLPASRSIEAPLARIFPLLSGNFQFAQFDGVLDSQGELEGNVADWRGSLKGKIEADLKEVRLVGSQEFGQVLSILGLNELNKSYASIKPFVSIGQGKVSLDRIEVDGDATKLPLVGATTFDGALDLGIDLSRARLGRKLEPYRDLVSLFRPGFGGSVGSPKFALRPPSAKQLLETGAKLAAGSLFGGGKKLDLSKLGSLKSLSDLQQMAEKEEPAAPPAEPGGATPPDPNQPPNPFPTSPTKPVVEVPETAGGMPPSLDRRFRALAKGKNRFDYGRLNTDKSFAGELQAWLAAAPPAPKGDNELLADLLNRYEVALALAAAPLLEDLGFRLTGGKKGIYGIDGFFDAKREIGGRRVSLEELAAEIRKYAGDLALVSTAGGSKGMPPIGRASANAKNVRSLIEERAAAFVAEHVRLNKKQQIVYPAYLFRAYNKDEKAVRDLLQKAMGPDHPCRAVIATAEIARVGESQELDEP